MSRIHKDSDYESDERILRIKPEGWVQEIVFYYGHQHMCGQAEDGIRTELSGERGGGVMTLDDLVAMRDMINQHLADVLHRKPSPEIPPEDDEE